MAWCDCGRDSIRQAVLSSVPRDTLGSGRRDPATNRMHEAETDSESDERGPIMKAELPIDAVEVRINGLACDAELARDFDGTAAVCCQAKNLSFPLGQDVENVVHGPSGSESGEVRSQLRRDVGDAASSAIKRAQ
jgi:hypothetical protein